MPTAEMDIKITVDEKTKQGFEEITDELGISAASAFTSFVKAVVRGRGIPFALSLKTQQEIDDERFYSPSNVSHLLASIEEAERGELVTFSSIEEMETAFGLDY